jgi:small-conductance mechanosensitive channel
LGLSLLIFIVGLLIASWAARATVKALKLRKVDDELIVLFRMIVRWGIVILAFYFAAETLAPGQLTAFIAGLGIAAFTVGFALQDVAKNFFAGILLLLQQPFEIGDTIEVAGYTGNVLNITLRSTEMRTSDGRFVSIPNADVFVSPIVNFTQAPRRRVELAIGVAYDSDLDQVSRTAIAAIQDIPGLLDDPTPSVTFNNFGDSAIGFSLFYWLDMAEIGFGDGQTLGIKAVKQAFEIAGIEMPYPTQTILMDQSG